MKRYIIPIGAVLVVMLVVWSAFGQEQEWTGQRENIGQKEKLQNMSEEEKNQLMAKVRVKSGSSPTGTGGREEQLKAIAAIQEQLEKLKTAIESVDEGAFRRFGELSEEERAKVRENMMKAAQTRQLAMRRVEEKLEVLRETGQRGAQPLMPIRELQVIRGVAVKEKATETASRITRLIARYHEELQTIRELAVKEKAKQTASRMAKLIARYEMEFKISQTPARVE